MFESRTSVWAATSHFLESWVDVLDAGRFQGFSRCERKGGSNRRFHGTGLLLFHLGLVLF
jgi:hypothetical protein